MGYGKAAAHDTTQMTTMVLTARWRLDMVWARSGWQIATYRSSVKAVIVRQDTDDVISVRNVFSRQYGSPNRHGYASQMVYSSGGKPVDNGHC